MSELTLEAALIQIQESQTMSTTVLARVTQSRSQSRRGLVQLEKLAKDPCSHTFGPLLGPTMSSIASKLQAQYRASHTAFATGSSI
jgi:hypothetical protein